MTKEEAKAYALKIAKESGVADEVATQISAAFDNEKFNQAFVPRPEVDRALSGEQSKYAQFKQRNEYLETEWYPTAKRAHDQALAVAGKLTKYQQLYGEIDETDPNAVRRAAAAAGIDESKVLELLDQRLSTALSSRDAATLDLMDIREDYMDKFKKRLPMKDFESHVAQQRKAGRADSLSALYKDWIAPEVEKTQNESFESRLKAAREEGARDYASRHKLPVSDRPREAHLLFDRPQAEGAKTSDATANKGRDAFLAELNDPRHYEPTSA